jgi:hypothetical protein
VAELYRECKNNKDSICIVAKEENSYFIKYEGKILNITLLHENLYFNEWECISCKYVSWRIMCTQSHGIPGVHNSDLDSFFYVHFHFFSIFLSVIATTASHYSPVMNIYGTLTCICSDVIMLKINECGLYADTRWINTYTYSFIILCRHKLSQSSTISGSVLSWQNYPRAWYSFSIPIFPES